MSETTQEISTVGKNQQHIYHNVSPFIGEVIEYVENKNYRKAMGTKYQDVMNYDTGELEKQKVLILGEQKKVDKQEFVKVYYGSICKMFELTKTAGKIYQYIVENITIHKDKICMNTGEVASVLGLSKSSVYKGITNLIDTKFIAKAERDGCYFINPAIAFKGERFTIVSQYMLDNSKPTMLREPDEPYQTCCESEQEPIEKQ